MKTRALIAALVLLPALALGQAIQGLGGSSNCSKPTATCKAGKFSLIAGTQLCLNSTTCSTFLKADSTSLGMVFQSAIPDSGTNTGYIFDTLNTLSGTTVVFEVRRHGTSVFSISNSPATGINMGGYNLVGISSITYQGSLLQGSAGQALWSSPGEADGAGGINFRLNTTATKSNATYRLISLANNGTEKFWIGSGGDVETGTFMSTGANGYGTAGGDGTAQGMAFSGSDTQVNAVAGNNVFLRSSSGTFLRANAAGIVQGTALNPMVVVHSAQTGSPVAMEFGSGTASAGGALAVTFATAFAIAPNCVCNDQNAAPAACGVSSAASTTAVTFTIGSARADTVQWHCQGNK